MTFTPQRIVKSVMDLSEKILLDLAIGADEPNVIAARHNLDEFDLDELLKRADVQKAIEVRQSELTTKGEFFKLKARALAEELLMEVFKDAQNTKDPKIRLDALKFLSMAGGIDKPIETKQQGSGRQVSISINLGEANRTINVDFSELFPEDANQDLIGEFEEMP